AVTLGFVHTVIGPDHYVPFIAIARARNWRLSKTIIVSALCGLGHVLSSVVLGFVGVGLGLAVGHLEKVESSRGTIAAWLLIGFGLVYLVWGLRKAYRAKPHTHLHYHADGEVHVHTHSHEGGHLHIHEEKGKEKENITPWVLFLIFVFGPCEPLIPLVMYPAAQHSTSGVIMVTAAFGLATILTMVTIIALSSWGLSFVKLGKLERYSHALAGAVIFVSGLAVQFLGL
ncbi:MAG TPA: sulfite exporter TauE/SafE family protein, partial [Anaerolineaceae bacterium]|nr:sulfite exporter TauE/SafE family protein [Anaerolineaceae bacterium]